MEYTHGGDRYRHQIEYDFSVNVNPLGMPEASLRAAKEGVMLAGRYPDSRADELCSAIAGAEGVDAGQVITGNGAAELIYALCYAVRPRAGLVAAPSFQEYEAALRAAGAQILAWESREEAGYRIEEGILDAIREDTDMVFLCNPNNPTGSLAEPGLLARIAQRCEAVGAYLCMDECFLPFLEEEERYTMKGRLGDFRRLIVLRAFTKLYGMPGLRLGYAMSANGQLLGRMKECMPPWNTSLPAQMAGIEAFGDPEYVRRTRKLIRQEKEYLLGELAGGLAEQVFPPSVNYIFFKAREDLQELLLRKKVLIRSCADYRNLGPGYFRIGVRTHEENEALIQRWKECMI